MIIETLTAFSSVKIVWETLEILHLVHVGHVTGKASYQGGNAIKQAIEQQQLKWHDQKNPALQLEREVHTRYDFQSADYAAQTIDDINNQTHAYLAALTQCVENLNAAKDYFLKIHTNVTELISALTAEESHSFASKLLQFKSNFESFKDKFNQFALSVEPPRRQLLYIADLFSEKKIIEKYNDRLKTIKTLTDRLEAIKLDIAGQFKQSFDVIPTLLAATPSPTALSFEQLQQDIKQSLLSPERLSEIMYARLPNNPKLADLCMDIAHISAEFKQSQQSTRMSPLENDPNWFPLLTESEQMEVGQRIVLHAMNETTYAADKKLLLAQVFLRQHISRHTLNQIEIDLMAYEMATILRSWQIKKCEQLIKFLNELTQKNELIVHDTDGLFDWLKTKRRMHSPIVLFTEILVSPCCFSQCNIESVLSKFKRLAPDENATMIQQHLDSYWSDIWKKNDTLIQLPESFSSSILPRHRCEMEVQSHDPNVISSLMHQLATALITDLQQLKIALENNQHQALEVKISWFFKKQKEAYQAQENQKQAAGVARIKKAHRYIYSISSSSNCLFPYLYHAETLNEMDKKRQVATVDDLLHVIYRGVDPNGVCYWKSSSSQPYSRSNQLAHYFFPNQHHDSRTKAWIYACTDCQVSAVRVFSHLFSPNDRPLALGNTPGSQMTIKNDLSIQAILKDPKKITAIATESKALNGATPKTVQETETVFQQLQNYYVLALVRVNPEYRNQLPLMKQLECLFKNFFKSTREIGQERLESVQIYIGDFCTALSEEHIDAINQAFNDLKRNYEDRCQQAKKVDSSALYTIMKKAFDGPIAAIQNQFANVDQKQLEKEKTELEKQLKKSQSIIERLEQDKTESEAKLKESEAKRMQEQAEADTKLAQFEAKSAAELAQFKTESAQLEAESAAELAQFKAKSAQLEAESAAELIQLKTKLAELDAKMEKITGFMDFINAHPTRSRSSALENQTQENSHARFFQH